MEKDERNLEFLGGKYNNNKRKRIVVWREKREGKEKKYGKNELNENKSEKEKKIAEGVYPQDLPFQGLTACRPLTIWL